MVQKSYDKGPSLYLVPTPIGNLEDITLRSINTLKEVEVIFSEDTRVTTILLNHFNIKKKLISLHEHNEDKVKEKVLEYLKNRTNVALVTDRGTPLISDPGYKTVKYIIENNYNVISLPGPTAFVPALTSSGISPQPFLFYGFLSSKRSIKKEELNRIKDSNYSVIIYEAPHRIRETLELMLDILDNRRIALVREISKRFETIYRGTIEEIIKEEIKGEIVIVIEPQTKKEEKVSIDIAKEVKKYINKNLTVRDSIKMVAKDNKISKNVVYEGYHRRSGE